MRATTGFLAMMLFFALALPASSQQLTTSMGSKTIGSTMPSSIPAFFSSPLAAPNFSAMSTKTSVPSPLNLGRMMPTFPNLQNTMLLRNLFGGRQMTVMTPKQQVPPPPKKK